MRRRLVLFFISGQIQERFCTLGRFRNAPPRADSVSYDYDLAVIGGGSGGMAVAKKAASYGAKVR